MIFIYHRIESVNDHLRYVQVSEQSEINLKPFLSFMATKHIESLNASRLF